MLPRQGKGGFGRVNRARARWQLAFCSILPIPLPIFFIFHDKASLTAQRPCQHIFSLTFLAGIRFIFVNGHGVLLPLSADHVAGAGWNGNSG